MLDAPLARALDSVQTLASRSISDTILTGWSPAHWDPTNPITLFIIQLLIIVLFTQGIGYVFSFIKQPKVIAEVVGGILLGPTVMGRIPNFTNTIFPPESIPLLNVTANLGLILFLFLIGVEVDIGVMKKNGRNAALVSIAGMVLPFAVGAAVAVPVYHRFVDEARVSFGHFLLFVGVAMAITAFPVLCRILTATKLLETRVGVLVLAAGVGNDVVGWVLLALTLALVNARTGATAAYILLCAIGWTIVLLWPIKKGFHWFLRRSGSLDHGPTPLAMVLTLTIVLASAFFTSIIGVHAIFGGFIAGLIIPHEGGFAIALVEKIDDLVSMLFLPIYFVLSGLNTNLGLLDNGEIWGYIILLVVVGFLGKFVGCAVVARFCGYTTRESGAIGMLMSCKGLVELIVLNVGLQAGIINTQLFSMFVVFAIVLTFVTTPGTLLIYPERFRVRAGDAPRRRGNKRSGTEKEDDLTGANEGGSGGREFTTNFLVVLQKIEHLAPVMLLTQMLEPLTAPAQKPTAIQPKVPTHHSSSSKFLESDISDESNQSSPERPPPLALAPVSGTDHTAAVPTIHIDALKLVELTGRMFSIMQSAEKDELLPTDDTLQLYKQFGRLRGLEVTPHISIVEQEQYPLSVTEHATDLGSELIIVPWTVAPVVGGSSSALVESSSSSSSKQEDSSIDNVVVNTNASTSANTSARTPFDNIFGADGNGSPRYTHFVRRIFAEAKSDVALFVDRGFGGHGSVAPGAGQHIFLPFFGGPDDRLALRFVVQLCQHTNVSATVVRIKANSSTGTGGEVSRASMETNAVAENQGQLATSESIQVHHAALMSNQLTVGHNQAQQVQNRLASDSADNIAWKYFTSSNAATPPRPASVDSALARISFITCKSATPLSEALNYAESACSSSPSSTPARAGHTKAHQRHWRTMLVVLGRGRRSAAVNHQVELARMLSDRGRDPNVGAELRKTVGDVATGLMLGGGKSAGASFLVLEAGL